MSVGRARADRLPWPCWCRGAAPAWPPWRCPAWRGGAGNAGGRAWPGLAPCPAVGSVCSASGRGGSVAAPSEELPLFPFLVIALSPREPSPRAVLRKPPLLPPSPPSRGCHWPGGLRGARPGAAKPCKESRV